MGKSKLEQKKQVIVDARTLTANQFIMKYGRVSGFRIMNIDDPFAPNKGFVNIEFDAIGCFLYITGRYDSFDSY